MVQFDALMFEQVAADLFGAVFFSNQFGYRLFDGSGEFCWVFLLFLLASRCCCALR